MADEISCPRCKTTKYRNPSLKLMVNTCGHGLCETCVDLLFAKGSGACPQCSQPLRRANFRYQLFEDSFVEKEVDIRKKILKDFNKREDDFATLREYNDYLEEIETIVYNLTYDIDADATKRKVEQYKKENQEVISKNRSKKSKDEELIEDLMEEEKDSQALRKLNLYDEQLVLKSKMKKNKQKEALVDELMFSDLPANQILATHANQQKRIELKDEQERQVLDLKRKELQERRGKPQFSTGIQIGKGGSVFREVPRIEAQQFNYEEFEIDLEGPSVPPAEELLADGYLLHVRAAETSEKAGGFVPIYPCHRALQDAFCGLYFERVTDD
ncbi:CDK-activating kinase assembly factor MAT1 [Halotydeus destructor]|nr:CDK-activating kinase assembly factor MAT1 [Halotydeus destructor]